MLKDRNKRMNNVITSPYNVYNRGENSNGKFFSMLSRDGYCVLRGFQHQESVDKRAKYVDKYRNLLREKIREDSNSRKKKNGKEVWDPTINLLDLPSHPRYDLLKNVSEEFIDSMEGDGLISDVIDVPESEYLRIRQHKTATQFHCDFQEIAEFAVSYAKSQSLDRKYHRIEFFKKMIKEKAKSTASLNWKEFML